MARLPRLVARKREWNFHWQDAVVGFGALWLMLSVPMEAMNYNLGANVTAYLGGALIAMLVALSSRTPALEWGVPIAGAVVVVAPFAFDVPEGTVGFWSFLGCGSAAVVFGLLSSAQKTAESDEPFPG